MCQFQLSDILDRGICNILAFDLNLTFVFLIQTCQCIDQFTLSVTLNSGNSQNFATFQVKRKIINFQNTLRIMYSQVTHSHQYIICEMLFFLVKFQRDFFSYHQTGHFLCGDILYFISSHTASVSHNGRTVTDLLDLVQLMGNKDNSVTFLSQLHQLDKKFICFLRSQYCCRLIQDQDLRTSVKGFQDFYLLLDTNRDLLYFLADINIKVVLFCNVLCCLDCFVHINEQPFLRRNSQNNVLSNCQRWHQHEMLMYHTYSLTDGILRRFDSCRLPSENDLALVRCFQSEKNLHQCALTGTILTEHRMNLAPAKLKGYIFIGYHTITVDFHDVVHL